MNHIYECTHSELKVNIHNLILFFSFFLNSHAYIVSLFFCVFVSVGKYLDIWYLLIICIKLNEMNRHNLGAYDGNWNEKFIFILFYVEQWQKKNERERQVIKANSWLILYGIYFVLDGMMTSCLPRIYDLLNNSMITTCFMPCHNQQGIKERQHMH